MKSLFNPQIAETAARNTARHFPLHRGEKLRTTFSELFSRHIGNLNSEVWFEGELLLITGQSESGKTRETNEVLNLLHAEKVPLPNGDPARIVQCDLSRAGGWKDLGRRTLNAMGYELSDNARLTQNEIWSRVTYQAKAQGIIGIHFDEVQHIFAGKSDNDREMVLDNFKTLLKSRGWPLMLIMSGVPELADHVRSLDQTQNKVTHVHFEGIDLSEDLGVIHEIVGSYAMENGLEVDEDLMTEDFYRRLAIAAALRWGTLIKMTIASIGKARDSGSTSLTLEHYVNFWAEKANVNVLATPFTQDGYETLFRPDKPFQVSLL
ncbi:ATP-binding protein [Lentibacter sp. XHP0401]|uniref:ATP-binding protein n=1 Tax=Lentibacter sp. XHP0401 TaxID=2984334 RepID=UPI0021E85843|nr:ATP-binding protein [Lentibacter sp. XHP0401]MCV2893730.1 ATP-binding protein [Lentibacter sp. XHP0401]